MSERARFERWMELGWGGPRVWLSPMAMLLAARALGVALWKGRAERPAGTP